MSVKINFNFETTKTSVTTAEFLLSIYNPDDVNAELKDHLQKALEGTALKVKDANSILQIILTAMTINDNEGDEVIEVEVESFIKSLTILQSVNVKKGPAIQ